MKKETKSSEPEFQGAVVGWLNEEIQKRPGMGLDRATQEKIVRPSGKRSDLVVWRDRRTEVAFLEIELKTPETPITDPLLLKDAIEKAQYWKAPYFAIWNMREAELYKTPSPGCTVTPEDMLKAWPIHTVISSVDSWLDDSCAQILKKRAIEILDSTWSIDSGTDLILIPIDSSVFVEKLTKVISVLRKEIYTDLKVRSARDRKLRHELKAIAAMQGFISFVQDIEEALAGQYGYRLVGQILFYFALRKKQPHLKELRLDPSQNILQALIPYWANVRRFDYEALFKPDRLDDLINLSKHAQGVIRDLVKQLIKYDWNSLKDDILGAVFEHLIPHEEQHLLGQFYTPRQVADLLIAFSVTGNNPLILDPGCGSGTFLMSAYDFISNMTALSHSELLSTIWGFDISSFAAELAAINLYRQDLSSYENFPRIVPGDFFAHIQGDKVSFPPAQHFTGDKVEIPIPHFDAVVGNPPYLRSQNQDDLDVRYKNRLFESARALGIHPASKTDLFLFFIYHALTFMRPGSRLGFVTSSSWLTADFAKPLKNMFLGPIRLVAVITSMAESFFSQVDINTTLLVIEKRQEKGVDTNEQMRFVTLKKKLADLFPQDGQYWKRLIDFTDSIESTARSQETDILRIKVVDVQKERAISDHADQSENWARYLRAPLSYYRLVGEAI